MCMVINKIDKKHKKRPLNSIRNDLRRKYFPRGRKYRKFARANINY